VRIGVLGTGFSTVRLAVCDVGDGVPLPVHTAKWKLRLSEQVGSDGWLGQAATDRL
jgi:exopolyphosphatase/guanosine-5'-triphosphate,3'-diphosphate pyrophosphatase